MSTSTPASTSTAAKSANPATSTDAQIMAAPTTIPSKDRDAKAAAAKQHRRSRSGCFTCRLRRKKCDEGRSACKACRHLGLKCEYKRPTWWGNGEQRREQKDTIKNIIKRTQVVNKTKQVMPPLGVHTPPSLSHSIPTSDGYPDSLAHSHTRASSTDHSPLVSDGFPTVSPEGYFAIPAHYMTPHVHAQTPYPMFSPYEIDIKTERQIFVNDVPTRRDSTISTFSTYQPPPLSSGLPALPSDSWIEQNHFESSKELFSEEPVDFDFFEFPHGQLTPAHETVIDVDDRDRPLLDHFLDKVLKLIFPVLDANQHGSARSGVILPALESNKCYLHCCLDVAAVHKKATERPAGDDIDADIVRHRFATISELCEALNHEQNYMSVLEATLAVIFFQCCVGRPDDALPEIPWHQHLQAATGLVQRLELPQQLAAPTFGAPAHPPFNMTLTAWIDILGSTMLGRSPVFADAYRDLNIAGHGAGLVELMGCEDHIMFLISEIACLEARKLEGMDEVMLCKYIEILGTEISLSEAAPASSSSPTTAIQSAISATGAIRPKQLGVNITAVFRLAARIYLCSMVPGFNAAANAMTSLVAAFADAMDFIPAGAEGFDRSLVWPLLIAGSVSTPNSRFRGMYAERCARLGDAAGFGSFGRVRELLADVWAANDALCLAEQTAAATGAGFQNVHWRDVMHTKGWDCLLI